MMTHRTQEKISYYTFGDAAVKGLLGGLVAGLVMAGVLVGFLGVGGASPTTSISYFAPVEGTGPLASLLSHLAVSGIYGIVFGLVWNATERGSRMEPSTWKVTLAGVGYGLLLWLVAIYIVLPESSSLLNEIPAGVFLISHLIFGAVLGWMSR